MRVNLHTLPDSYFRSTLVSIVYSYVPFIASSSSSRGSTEDFSLTIDLQSYLGEQLI